MTKLITKKIAQDLLSNALRVEQGVDALNLRPVVKFFTPDAGATWLIVSAERAGDDVILFGWCDLGVGFPELGTVSLQELQSVRGKIGLPVERDLYFRPQETLQQIIDQSANGHAICI